MPFLSIQISPSFQVPGPNTSLPPEPELDPPPANPIQKSIVYHCFQSHIFDMTPRFLLVSSYKYQLYERNAGGGHFLAQISVG